MTDYTHQFRAATDYTHQFRAAVVQAEPVWLDLEGGIDKVIALSREAKRNGAQIVAFPETFIPGYPWYLWLDSVAWQSQFTVRYAQNSLEIGSEQWKRIERAAAEIGITIALGFSEREGGSMYMAQALIDDTGRTLMTRRKLKPTHVERTQFGDGDGSDFEVVDTPVGRVGALNCWEHLQPLTKYALFAQQEQLHIAAWPSFSIFEGAVNALGAEVNNGASRQYAVEGQNFVLAPCAVVGEAAQELFCDTDMKKQFLGVGGGYARIYGPDGRSLAEPLDPAEEGILYADIDYAGILAAKNAADPVGHYSRPDVFALHLEKRGRLPKVTAEPVRAEAPEAAAAEAEAQPVTSL
ncbi:MAG: carbon-nitrogen hydrolase family protein [Candidatus Leucobacter sulfamidivorax]|nr:carbon-nitrogen hydrolase family protein [Candidatus Leucobacter sulfamidivorax]